MVLEFSFYCCSFLTPHTMERAPVQASVRMQFHKKNPVEVEARHHPLSPSLCILFCNFCGSQRIRSNKSDHSCVIASVDPSPLKPCPQPTCDLSQQQEKTIQRQNMHHQCSSSFKSCGVHIANPTHVLSGSEPNSCSALTLQCLPWHGMPSFALT